jgi:hypothetical protein
MPLPVNGHVHAVLYVETLQTIRERCQFSALCFGMRSVVSICIFVPNIEKPQCLFSASWRPYRTSHFLRFGTNCAYAERSVMMVVVSYSNAWHCFISSTKSRILRLLLEPTSPYLFMHCCQLYFNIASCFRSCYIFPPVCLQWFVCNKCSFFLWKILGHL